MPRASATGGGCYGFWDRASPSRVSSWPPPAFRASPCRSQLLAAVLPRAPASVRRSWRLLGVGATSPPAGLALELSRELLQLPTARAEHLHELANDSPRRHAP